MTLPAAILILLTCLTANADGPAVALAKARENIITLSTAPAIVHLGWTNPTNDVPAGTHWVMGVSSDRTNWLPTWTGSTNTTDVILPVYSAPLFWRIGAEIGQ